MFPKQILIKSTSKNFLNLLDKELKQLPSIRYFYRKINDYYTIVIKCGNYYEKINSVVSTSFYGSYIYLYTNISLLLSTLILNYYEQKLVHRILKTNYFYFTDADQKQIFNIASSFLDPQFPLKANEDLFLYRKQSLLNLLLRNFRNHNYINIESFVNFSVTPYYCELENIVDSSVELYVSDIGYLDLIQFILKNWLP